MEEPSLDMWNDPPLSPTFSDPTPTPQWETLSIFSSADPSEDSFTTARKPPFSVSTQAPPPPKKAPLYFDNPKHPPIVEKGRTYRFEDDPLLYKKIKKTIQNRKASSKSRHSTKSNLSSLHETVTALKLQNSSLLSENTQLKSQNQALSKKCEFYHKTLAESLKQSSQLPQDEKDFEILFEPRNEYTRVSIKDSASKHFRFFFMFTIFTIVIQFVDLPEGNSKGNGSGFALKSFERGAVGAMNWAWALGGLKLGSAGLWLVLLVLNLVRVLKQK